MRSLTRLKHRVTDFIDLLSFSLCPFSTATTKLAVGKSSLNILQWPGRRVGSGGFVWDGARRLTSHFDRHGDGCGPNLRSSSNGLTSAAIPGRPWKGMSVLELGAGTGAAGLATAALGANVTLTDQASFCFPGPQGGDNPNGKLVEAETLLDLMRTNVTQNEAAFLGQKPAVSEMLWGNIAHMAALPPIPERSECGEFNEYGMIVGTDILLFQDAQEFMVQSLRRLSGPSTVVMIEHTDRTGGSGETYPADLLNFLGLLAEDGLWSPAVVRDNGRHITLRMVRRREDEAPFSGNIPRL